MGERGGEGLEGVRGGGRGDVEGLFWVALLKDVSICGALGENRLGSRGAWKQGHEIDAWSVCEMDVVRSSF
jgi:hypothetical protein